MFDGKSILVTGGTGTFGRAFVRTILQRWTPNRLVVYSRDELKQSEMSAEFDNPAMRYFLGDVRDLERLSMAMADVDYVVHAAALKQVPAAEYNPMECVKTNIYGAENVIKAAISNEVNTIIALSTDKAANPVNLYGATKLVSDKLFVAANNIAGRHRTRFSVVRYGNVVGSRGSVVPLFKKLITEGVRSLPVTHPAMTRFWITLQQGVDFVLRSFERIHGGEILVPKIPSMRIVDLAESLVPGGQIRIVGVRPGEKLHEVMCPEEVSHLTIELADHYLIQPSIRFYGRDINFAENRQGESGTLVKAGFEYNSGTNPVFLTIDELRELNEQMLQ